MKGPKYENKTNLRPKKNYIGKQMDSFESD